MKIGIDASRAFQKNRTGIEEYSFQVIKHLMDKLEGHQVVLYLRTTSCEAIQTYEWTKKMPVNCKIKIISWPFLWTQLGLSLELLFHPVDALFVPAHIVPAIHPINTTVTVHGLEYEFYPKAYSFWERLYMRWSIKKSCQWAKKIIAVSENTKKDLVNLYKVPKEKIKVIYEGCNLSPFGKGGSEGGFENPNEHKNPSPRGEVLPLLKGEKYLLFIGRLEERKNIIGIIEAYNILKEKYNILHKLVLVGKPGYNFTEIKNKIESNRYEEDIVLTGFVGDTEKWELLKNASTFLFPTFYEGFGLPILEAQSTGIPVVASNNSSIPEVANDSALLVDPKNPSEIAGAVYKLISDETLRNDIIEKGYENIKRFSWEKCSSEIANYLLNEKKKAD